MATEIATVPEVHARVLAFLGSELARKENRLCVKLELVHVQRGVGPEPFKTWHREETPELFQSLAYTERLTHEIVALCQSEGSAAGPGRHRFKLRTTQHLGERQLCSFTLTIDKEDDGGGLDDASPDLTIVGTAEASTATGLLAQAMRNNEQMMRWINDMMKGSVGILAKTVERLSEEAAAMRKERTDHLAELEAARSTESEREIALLKQGNSDARKDKAMGKILPLLPVLASRFVPTNLAKSKDGKPAEPSMIEKLIAKLLIGITEAQAEQIDNVLTMEQRIAFGEALRVANEGGSMALPLLVNDLLRGLGSKRVQFLMTVLTQEQRMLLMEAMQHAPPQEDAQTAEEA